jgi:IrrE N-terminal-like domain
MSQAALAAGRVLDELGVMRPEHLLALEEIAWRRGVAITEAPLSGAEAWITMLPGKARMRLSSSITDPRRRRFTIAHELGHFELHRFARGLGVCQSGDLDDWRFDESQPNNEREANQFAADLLLPRRFVEPLCMDADPSLEGIGAIADRFITSLTATAIRYTEYCPHPVAVVFSTAGMVRWYRPSADFRESGLRIDTKVHLLPQTYAGAYFRDGTVPEERRTVPAAAWLEGRLAGRLPTIQEQTWPLSAHHSTLSLLWIDAELPEDEEDEWDS